MRDFKSSYTFNSQYDGAAIFFVIIKIVRPDTCALLSDINYNLETWRCLISNMTSPKSICRLWNVWIRYPLLGVNIQTFWGRNSPSTSPYHAHSSRTTWRPGGVIGRSTRISHQSSWGPWPWRIITTSSPQGCGLPGIPRVLIEVAQKLSDDSKKSSERSNTSKRETTKGEPSYIRDLSPWILE